MLLTKLLISFHIFYKSFPRETNTGGMFRTFSIIHQIQIWKSTIFIFCSQYCSWCYFQMFTEWPKRFKGKKKNIFKSERCFPHLFKLCSRVKTNHCVALTHDIFELSWYVFHYTNVFSFDDFRTFRGKLRTNDFRWRHRLLSHLLCEEIPRKDLVLSSPKGKCWGVASHFGKGAGRTDMRLVCPCMKLKSSIVRA